MNKVNKKYLIISIISVLIILLGVTAAYWIAKITGDGSQITVTVDTLKIKFTDTQEIIDSEIYLNWSTKKEFTVENESDQDYIYNINIEKLTNNLVTDTLEYKITSDTGFTMDEFKPVEKCTQECIQTIAESITIGPRKTHTYEIEFRYLESETLDQTQDMGKTVSGRLSITKDTNSLLVKDFGDIKFSDAEQRKTFDTVLSEGKVYYEDGNYTEDGKKVYYFTGAADNNWFKFANYWWRIIRTNEDGSLRLLYAGTSPDTQEGYIGGQTYSYNGTTYNNAAYVGYMYGNLGSLTYNRDNTTDSEVKKTIDKWYQDNILASYDKYVSKTAIYCNDRANDNYNPTIVMYYAASKRITNKASSYGGASQASLYRPSFKCGLNYNSKPFSDSNTESERKKDLFTAINNEGIGNQKLTYPVALLTADEVAFAGGLWSTDAPNTYFYLNSEGNSVTGDKWWWTMTPYGTYSGGNAYVFKVQGSENPGHLVDNGVAASHVIRPVLSIKDCVRIKGQGTVKNPYEVADDISCEKETLSKYFANKYSNATERTDFSNIEQQGEVHRESGAYTEDIDGDEEGEEVYYWTGNVTDNWVQFADIYWRIIRTNEDGSLRLLYAGIETNTTEGYINPTGGPSLKGNYSYNSHYGNDDTIYAGYMYGTTGDKNNGLENNRKNTESSSIKKEIDTWYETNIIKTDNQNYQYSDYVSKTAIYCNDRSNNSYAPTSLMYYAAGERLTTLADNYGGTSKESQYRPSYKCGNTFSGTLHLNSSEADKFTTPNSKGIGNQLLTYPVALMTADEVVYAGGKFAINNKDAYYYLNSDGLSVVGSKYYWTMTPLNYIDGATNVFGVYGLSNYRGKLSNQPIGYSDDNVIRPVLSLKSCVKLAGTGSTTDPYIPVIDDKCAASDN